MEGLLTGRGDLDDNVRMLKHTGREVHGRSLCLWGNEANFLANLQKARKQCQGSPGRSGDGFAACVFEIVTPSGADRHTGLGVCRRSISRRETQFPLRPT